MRTASELVFDHVGLGAAAVPYERGWDLQRQVHEQRVRGAIPDTCLLLEHEPVYTAGKRTGALERPVADPGAPVIDVDRGGKITWHGPGQLTGYPVIGLPDPVDVVAYVRTLEEALIGVCADFGVRAGRVQGRSGVWVSGDGTADGTGDGTGPDRKVASIGIRVARGVTMHGFALNCDCDLAWFGRIVPCGIPDAVMTSLSAEAGRPVTVPDVIGPVQRRLAGALGASGWRVAGQGQPLTAIA